MAAGVLVGLLHAGKQPANNAAVYVDCDLQHVIAALLDPVVREFGQALRLLAQDSAPR